MDVFFVSPEEHLNVLDGIYVDLWMAAENAQEAIDLFAAYWDVEITQPVRVYLTEETVTIPEAETKPWLEACLKGRLPWNDHYVRLHETTDWTTRPIEHVTPTWRPEEPTPEDEAPCP